MTKQLTASEMGKLGQKKLRERIGDEAYSALKSKAGKKGGWKKGRKRSKLSTIPLAITNE